MIETTIESPPVPMCEECGAPADVHVTDMVGGSVTMQHFCGNCVDALSIMNQSKRRRFSAASILITVGMFVLALSTLADYLQFGINSGFGFFQLEGVMLGTVVLLLGAVAKARTLFSIGAAIAGISLLADWLAFGSAPGFGIQQKLGCLLGLAILIAGVWISFRRR